MDLGSLRRRGSTIVDELAEQDLQLAKLQRQLEVAKSEGERLKQSAAEEVTIQNEAPAVDVDIVSSPVPTMAELFKMAEAKDGRGPPRATCSVCALDSYALRSQLIPCSRCAAVSHAGCVGLRPIPFKGSTTSEVNNRELYIRRYHSEWICAGCKQKQMHTAVSYER